MSKLLVAAALVAAIASPALAQTASRPTQSYYNQNRGDGQRHSGNPGYDVYQSGQYLGSDPDRNIRSELRRDSEANDPN